MFLDMGKDKYVTYAQELEKGKKERGKQEHKRKRMSKVGRDIKKMSGMASDSNEPVARNIQADAEAIEDDIVRDERALAGVGAASHEDGRV